jgi:hypothetical protein
MQMLHAVVIACIGSYLAFEIKEINRRPVLKEIASGAAAKCRVVGTRRS